MHLQYRSIPVRRPNSELQARCSVVLEKIAPRFVNLRRAQCTLVHDELRGSAKRRARRFFAIHGLQCARLAAFLIQFAAARERSMIQLLR